MNPVIRAEGDIEGGAARFVPERRIADESFAFFRRFLRLGVAGASLLSAAAAVAAPLHVAIATPALPSTFVVAFDLVDGGEPANSVTIASLSTDGTFGAATFTGGASASAGVLTVVDAQFFNEILLPVSAANTLSFDVDMTMAPPQAGSLPDAFSLFLLDAATLLPLATTTDPSGADALFTIQSGDSPFGPFTVFADSGGSASASWTVAPSVSAVPEPATLVLIVVGLGAIMLRRYRGAASVRLIGVASLMFPGLVLAAVHVSPSGGTSFPHDGAKWETAFSATELQTAINKNPGAEFWFSKGAYGQLQNVPDGTQLYGGFVGGLLGETSRNERDAAANFTSFDGIIITSYDDGTGTNTKIVQGPNTVVDGFTIAGFGFLLEQASPTLSHNVVIGAPVGISMNFGAAPVVNDSQITGGTYGVTVSGPVQTIKVGPNRVEAKPTINRSTISGGSIGLLESPYNGKLPTLVVNATTFSGSKASGMELYGNTVCTDCIVEKNGLGFGMGVVVSAHDAAQTITFERCKIRDNLGTGLLAAVSANTNVILRRCEITGNNLSAAANLGAPAGGGGVQINGDGVQIIESKIVGNKTIWSGGGVYIASFVNPASRNLIVDSLIAGNGAAMNGGGIAAGRQSFTVLNSTIAGNSAAVGGGIWLEQFDPPNFIPTISFVNTAIVGNLAPLGSATALELLTIAPGNLFHNVVTLSSDTHVSSYNHVVRPAPLGNGNFTVADAGFIAAASGDYRLGASSPLVDRGDSAPISAYIAAGGGATDLAGLPRIAGTAVDIGAYETASAGVTDVTSQVSLRLGGFVFDRASRRYTQIVTLANSSGGVLAGPISLVFDGLSAGVTVAGMTNVTVHQAPAGSPYLDVSTTDLVPGALLTLSLRFDDPLNVALRYVPRVLAGMGTR
jgi:hypothetical protein